jgi:hypothetical protein
MRRVQRVAGIDRPETVIVLRGGPARRALFLYGSFRVPVDLVLCQLPRLTGSRVGYHVANTTKSGWARGSDDLHSAKTGTWDESSQLVRLPSQCEMEVSMSTVSVRHSAGRASGRQLAAIAVLIVMLGMIFGVIGPVLPAQANQPYVEGTVVCVDGVVMIQWKAYSWLQTGGPGSGNPDIVVRFDSVPVASGAFTAENGYEFSGQNPWPNPDIQLPGQAPDTVYVLVYAAAPFDNGTGQGTSTRRTVTLPAGFAEECAPTTTTTQPPSTTTTAPPTTTTTEPPTTTTTEPPTTTTTEPPTTTTTEPPTTTTTEPPTTTTTAPPTTTTTGPPTASPDAETGVLGIQVSLPANAQVNQVTQQTLPFTGITTGSMAVLAAALAGAGLLLLLAGRQHDEKRPGRSWN